MYPIWQITTSINNNLNNTNDDNKTTAIIIIINNKYLYKIRRKKIKIYCFSIEIEK